MKLEQPEPTYTILFTSSAKQDVDSLDGSIKKRLRKVLEDKIAVDPQQYGLPLRGVLAGYWKHRFASHRVIYRIDEGKRLVVICAVGLRSEGHKSDVYQRLEALAKTGKVADQVLEVLRASLEPKR